MHADGLPPVVFDVKLSPVAVEPDTTDFVQSARTFFRWFLTLGAAALYAFLVMKVSIDVWEGTGSSQVQVDTVFAGVMNSIALTFGSAFVGWFGISSTGATVTISQAASFRIARKAWRIVTQLPGAAVLAMLAYLAVGAFAGLTYVFNQPQTPTVLITVATAWAAQASAVVAATLATVLKSD